MAKLFKAVFSRRKTRVPAILAIIFLAVVAWQIVERIFFSGKASGPNQRGISVAVEIAPIEKGGIRDIGRYTGSLIPKSTFMVAPKISGRLKQLLSISVIRSGRISSWPSSRTRNSASGHSGRYPTCRWPRPIWSSAESSLETAKREMERAKSLHQKGIQSDSELETVISQFDAQNAKHKVAVAQVSNREAALQTARIRLSYTRIRASWEKGSDLRYVGERFVDEGALLSPNTSILSIIELQPIIAVIYVTDREYFRLKLDSPAAITSIAYPGEAFNGHVARIAPLLKETSREARVEIEIDNSREHLKPGMFVNAQIEFARRQATAIVPMSALVTRSGQQGVFLADIENKKAVYRAVRVGIIEADRAEILEPPLGEGFVVTLGHHLLEDGTTIILPQNFADSNEAKAEAGRETASDVASGQAGKR